MKKIINTSNAPAPVGPYNQAVVHNGLLFISGQIPIDPHTGILKMSNITEETTQVMENIKAILDKAGCTFESVLKASIFSTSMNNFSAVNEVYAQYFKEETAPAREFVEVSALPKGVNVEISMIAAID
jgi:2-iminobutanoate/2-iminopropanoate deaminase